jgi:hypothetical protein
MDLGGRHRGAFHRLGLGSIQVGGGRGSSSFYSFFREEMAFRDIQSFERLVVM